MGKRLSGAASGAAAGSVFGPWGAVVGGGLGAIFGGDGGAGSSTSTSTNTPNLYYPLDPRQPTGTPTTFSPFTQDRLGMTSPYDPFQNIDEATYNQRIADGSTRATWLPDILGNRHYGESLPYDTSADSEFSDLQSSYMDMLRQAMGQYGSGGFQAPRVGASLAHASQASATHAVASLIDMLDKAYQREPDASLREDVYGRLSSGARANAADQKRGIMDLARLSGAGPQAPWVAALSAKADRSANADATQGLTDFFDQFVTAALARRAGALSTNANLQTGVNTFNAGADNQVSMFNAGARNQVSMFNAGSRNSANSINAANALQAAGLNQGLLSQIMRGLEFGLTPQQRGGTVTQTNREDPGWGTEIGNLLQLLVNARGGGTTGANTRLGQTDSGFAFMGPG